MKKENLFPWLFASLVGLVILWALAKPIFFALLGAVALGFVAAAVKKARWL